MVWSSPFVVVRLDNLLLQNRIPEKGGGGLTRPAHRLSESALRAVLAPYMRDSLISAKSTLTWALNYLMTIISRVEFNCLLLANDREDREETGAPKEHRAAGERGRKETPSWQGDIQRHHPGDIRVLPPLRVQVRRRRARQPQGDIASIPGRRPHGQQVTADADQPRVHDATPADKHG